MGNTKINLTSLTNAKQGEEQKTSQVISTGKTPVSSQVSSVSPKSTLLKVASLKTPENTINQKPTEPTPIDPLKEINAKPSGVLPKMDLNSFTQTTKKVVEKKEEKKEEEKEPEVFKVGATCELKNVEFFPEYQSKFKKNKKGFMKSKLISLKKISKTNKKFVFSIIMMTVLGIGGLFFLDPKNHSIEMYKASVVIAYEQILNPTEDTPILTHITPPTEEVIEDNLVEEVLIENVVDEIIDEVLVENKTEKIDDDVTILSIQYKQVGERIFEIKNIQQGDGVAYLYNKKIFKNEKKLEAFLIYEAKRLLSLHNK